VRGAEVQLSLPYEYAHVIATVVKPTQYVYPYGTKIVTELMVLTRINRISRHLFEDPSGIEPAPIGVATLVVAA
jgi:hypothetical protein